MSPMDSEKKRRKKKKQIGCPDSLSKKRISKQIGPTEATPKANLEVLGGGVRIHTWCGLIARSSLGILSRASWQCMRFRDHGLHACSAERRLNSEENKL